MIQSTGPLPTRKGGNVCFLPSSSSTSHFSSSNFCRLGCGVDTEPSVSHASSRTRNDVTGRWMASHQNPRDYHGGSTKTSQHQHHGNNQKKKKNGNNNNKNDGGNAAATLPAHSTPRRHRRRRRADTPSPRYTVDNEGIYLSSWYQQQQQEKAESSGTATETNKPATAILATKTMVLVLLLPSQG